MTVQQPEASPTTARSRGGSATLGIVVTVIWAAAVVIGVFSPDMITGSQHEHLPIVGITAWIWAVVASAYALLAARGGAVSAAMLIGTSAIWAAAVIGALASPELVTGTDPTRIPIVSILVPVLAAIATGFLAVLEARSQPATVRPAAAA